METMITKNQISANIRAYYLSRIDWIALTVVGVIQIWTENGLKLADILLLQAIFGFLIMVLEYPSGVLADLTSRKNVLIISKIGQICGLLVYFIANNILGFAVAEIFFAVGLAAASGADTAHIYDTYLEINKKERADEILSNGKSIRFFAMMILTALGGLLTSLNWTLPFIIAITAYLIQAMAYHLSHEPERIKSDNTSSAVRESIKYLINPVVIKASLILLFVVVFLRISFWDYLPRMELLGVETYWYGILLAGANFVAFLSSLIIRKYKSFVNFELKYVVIGMLGLILFINQTSIIIVLISIMFHQLYRGAAQVIFEIKINEQIKSNVRASAISLVSSIIQGTFFVLIGIMNILDLSSVGIHTLNMAMGGFIALLIVILSFFEKSKNLNSNKETSKYQKETIEQNIVVQKVEL